VVVRLSGTTLLPIFWPAYAPYAISEESTLRPRARPLQCADQSILALYSTPQIAFRPADFATLTSLQMRSATLSRSGGHSLRSAKNRSASSTRCTSVDDYHMSLPRIELGNMNHA
jgi:hypothetical protein